MIRSFGINGFKCARQPIFLPRVLPPLLLEPHCQESVPESCNPIMSDQRHCSSTTTRAHAKRQFQEAQRFFPHKNTERLFSKKHTHPTPPLSPKYLHLCGCYFEMQKYYLFISKELKSTKVKQRVITCIQRGMIQYP